MKKILCYGDSNTWGAVSGTKDKRYNQNQRWTKLLQKQLGDKYEVIEEGFRSRTTAFDDFKGARGNRNGATFFGQCVYTHDPLDYIIIFLGTNDLKSRFNANPKLSAKNIKTNYIDLINSDFTNDLIKKPKIVIIAPSVVKEGFLEDFDGAEDKSKKFNSEYQEMASQNNVLFVDNENLICGIDGVHLTEQSHNILALKLFNILQNN